MMMLLKKAQPFSDDETKSPRNAGRSHLLEHPDNFWEKYYYPAIIIDAVANLSLVGQSQQIHTACQKLLLAAAGAGALYSDDSSQSRMSKIDARGEIGHYRARLQLKSPIQPRQNSSRIHAHQAT